MKSRKIKELLSILLVLLLAVSAVGPAAFAESQAPAATTEPAAADQAAVDQASVDQTSTDQASDWWNILLLGGDSRSRSSYDRTDSMIILSINKTTGEAKMTSIMRDTWVSFPGKPQKGKGKINAANVYGGPDLAVKTVNACFGTDITDYVLINMWGLVNVIDQVGGVDIPVSAGERKWINTYARDYVRNFGAYDGANSLDKTGDSVHLNGLLAMSYCRNRYIGTDYARTQRQRTVLLAVLDKLKGENPAQLASVVGTAFQSVETNLSLMDVLSLASFGVGISADSIEQYRIPADGTFQSGMFGSVWCIKPNFDKNAQLLKAFIYGPDQPDAGAAPDPTAAPGG